MRKFPKTSEKSKLRQIGEQTVARAVTENIGWLFRKVHQEDDFGIDAYFDVVNNLDVTGQSVAAQVKCGVSYFSEPTNDGHVYRGDDKHLNYYANFDVPVVVVIVHPDTRVCNWVLFDLTRVTKTKKGWKLIIPDVNTLQSRSEFDDVIPPSMDAAEIFEMRAKVASLIRDTDRLLYMIDRRDIEHMDFDKITDFFNMLQESKEHAIANMSKVVLSIHGYDYDYREVYEIPEIRTWLQEAEGRVKYWSFFVDMKQPNIANFIYVLARCILNYEIIERTDEGVLLMTPPGTEIAPFFQRHIQWLNEISAKLGISEIDNRRLTALIRTSITSIKHDEYTCLPIEE